MMNSAQGKLHIQLYETEAKLYMVSSFLVFPQDSSSWGIKKKKK